MGKQSNIYRALLYAGTLGAIPLRRVDRIEELYGELLASLRRAEQGLPFLELLAICCVFWNKNVGIAELQADDSKGFKDVLK
jgi:hypothetical protein